MGPHPPGFAVMTRMELWLCASLVFWVIALALAYGVA